MALVPPYAVTLFFVRRASLFRRGLVALAARPPVSGARFDERTMFPKMAQLRPPEVRNSHAEHWRASRQCRPEILGSSPRKRLTA